MEMKLWNYTGQQKIYLNDYDIYVIIFRQKTFARYQLK